MAFLLSSERPAAAAGAFNPLRALFRWIAERRAKHAQRLALSSLLDFDSSLLEDLGIDRQDVLEALRHPDRSGATLAARRAATSRDWLSQP